MSIVLFMFYLINAIPFKRSNRKNGKITLLDELCRISLIDYFYKLFKNKDTYTYLTYIASSFLGVLYDIRLFSFHVFFTLVIYLFIFLFKI